jgi:shikimate 5-dehydrogenase
MSFISIIGSGGMAAAIGGLAAKAGHTVEVTSRGAAKARALAEHWSWRDDGDVWRCPGW